MSRLRASNRSYDYNFGVGVNYYHPMIEYIDAKESGRHVRYPNISRAYERGLDEYSPRKLARSYTQEDLSRISRRTEARASDHLQDFKTKTQSSFLLHKSASASMLTTQVKTETRKKKETGRKMDVLKSRMADEIIPYDPNLDKRCAEELKSTQKYLRGKSAKAIETQLLSQSNKHIAKGIDIDLRKLSNIQTGHDIHAHTRLMCKKMEKDVDSSFMAPLENLHSDLKGFSRKTSTYFHETSKATSIELERLSARVVEAEANLKSEVSRIKNKLQIQITELENSLEACNASNIDLQKTVKKQSLQLTDITVYYDEVQQQLQATLEQLSASQRRIQSLTAESEELRCNYDAALREKKVVEKQYGEAISRVNELKVSNTTLSSSKSKIEQEYKTISAEYCEIKNQLRISDERHQRIQTEMKHTLDMLHTEQDRVVRIEAVKKSLEVDVKNLSSRLEEVETNAIIGGKRIVSKLEARICDIECELEDEKRRHAETIKILHKKEFTVKEIMIQCEEAQKNILLLQEALDKSSQKVIIFTRQLQEQEGVSHSGVTRVRRFHREIEAADDHADSSVSLIRAKHRSFVTTSSVRTTNEQI